MVAIFKRENSCKKFICAGVLIKETAIITKANCLTSAYKSKEDYVLHIGRYNIEDKHESNYEEHYIKQIIRHPDWRKKSINSQDANLAIAILEKPVTYGPYIQPVCLWTSTYDNIDIDNRHGTVVGWGGQMVKRISSSVPWMLEVTVLPQATCLQSNQAFSNMTSDRTFCGSAGIGAGPCKGDGGSGFYMQRGEKWYLRGLVATTVLDPVTQSCDLKEPTVYIDVAKFQDWIDSVLVECN
jgi:secreted trypsin-like serine protease